MILQKLFLRARIKVLMVNWRDDFTFAKYVQDSHHSRRISEDVGAKLITKIYRGLDVKQIMFNENQNFCSQKQKFLKSRVGNSWIPLYES